MWLLTVWVYCILRYICVLASQRLIVACSFHPEAYGRGSLLCLHATWTKTLWVIYSGAGELSLPWTPASSGTPKAAISPLLCRSVAVLYSTPWSLLHCLMFSEPLFINFFFFAIVGNASYIYHDELPVQIPGWWPDQDQGLCQVCICGCCLCLFVFCI